MAENSTPDERTEDPTDRRLQELRKHGNMHMSTEVVQVSTLLIGFLSLFLLSGFIITHMQHVMIGSFTRIRISEPIQPNELYQGFVSLLLSIGVIVFVIGAVVATSAILSVMLQTKWNVKEKWLEVKLETLNPIAGIKRIFSVNGLVKTLQAIFKLLLILPIAYFGLVALAPKMVMLVHLSVREVLKFTADAMFILFWRIMYILIALAIFDYFWTRYRWFRQNRMTKEEVKDERKSIEGDEQTKRKIQSKGLQRIWQRIQQSVPQADVVITNPTHYAVALKYDRGKMGAPVVVAKGKGFLAQRIRRIAQEAGVPVLERKPLARALYNAVEVGSEIPYELFKAVAEVLAYVYRLKNPYGYRGASA